MQFSLSSQVSVKLIIENECFSDFNKYFKDSNLFIILLMFKFKIVVVIVITGIVLHPRFVVIGKCMAYKLSLFFTCII